MNIKKKNKSKITSKHPLIGTWRHGKEYLNTEVTILPNKDDFEVEMFDSNDGEKFVISNVKSDKEALKFDSLMPSTGRWVYHTIRSISKNQVEDNLCFTNSYIIDANKRKKRTLKVKKYLLENLSIPSQVYGKERKMILGTNILSYQLQVVLMCQ